MNTPWPPRDHPDFDQLSPRAQYMRMFSALRSMLVSDYGNANRLVEYEAQQAVSVFGEMLRGFALFFADYWSLPIPDIVPPRPLAFYRDTNTLWIMIRDYVALRDRCNAIMMRAPLSQVENRRDLLNVLVEMAALFGCPVYAAPYDETADYALAWAMHDMPLSRELTEMVGRQLPPHYRYHGL